MGRLHGVYPFMCAKSETIWKKGKNQPNFSCVALFIHGKVGFHGVLAYNCSTRTVTFLVSSTTSLCVYHS
jgi:hypothetical protein